MTFSFKYGQEDYTIRTANQEYLYLLNTVMKSGHQSKPRSMTSLEVMGISSRISMSHPRVSIPERNIGKKFRYAEAWWILSGRNDVESIRPYSKAIDAFSDDGVYFAGAYGPKIVDQLPYVVRKLHKDNDTRQAVMNIWRENMRDTMDLPCTLSLQFLIREGHLHCIANMRSSDLWLGWPYDIFNFSMVTRRVMELLLLNEPSYIRLLPGYLQINHGSLHLYEEQWEVSKSIVDKYNKSMIARMDLECEFPWLFTYGINLTNTLGVLKDDPDAS